MVTEQPKNRISKYNKHFDYSIAREDYIKQKLRLCDIRDKYSLTLSNYKYLHKKRKADNWDLQREQYWCNITAKATEKIADTRGSVILSLDVFLRNAKAKLEDPNLRFKSTQELINTVDTVAKLKELLSGNSTENISVTTTHKQMISILQKLR